MNKSYIAVDITTMRIVGVSKDLGILHNTVTELTDEWWRFTGHEPNIKLYEVKELTV